MFTFFRWCSNLRKSGSINININNHIIEADDLKEENSKIFKFTDVQEIHKNEKNFKKANKEKNGKPCLIPSIEETDDASKSLLKTKIVSEKPDSSFETNFQTSRV